MRISEIVLENFRCFGPEPTTVKLSDLTALVGSNASGKTAILQALQKLFGVAEAERRLRADDFHIKQSAAEDGETPSERTLSIEVKLEFPELEEGEDEEEETDETAVAECFRQMIVREPGGTPYCKIRLEGEWTAGNLPEGEVEQHTYWLRATGDDEEGADEDDDGRIEMRAIDRSRIHVHYVPAARDPMKQVRSASGSILGRLLKAVCWSDAVKGAVETASEDVQDAFDGVAGVGAIQKALSKTWKSLHYSQSYSGVKIHPISRRLEDILRNIDAVFTPSPGGDDHSLERLSEGQRSLFYFALVAAAFDIEEEVLGAETFDDDDWDLDRLDPPSLTLFAVEEPENHISPHYLGRIMDELRRVTKSQRAQVVLASHSPSILRRVEPEEVRHLRLDGKTRTSVVRRITLPKKTNDAHKFIREAVRAYPELYFAKLVVLGEGDSEEIVIPRIAEAQGLPIDQSFVSIVPLGGRHVNHMWRLLRSLDIPHITLLDLDRERHGGGWGRIKYVVDELLAVGVAKKDIRAVEGGAILSDKELEKMPSWNVANTDSLKSWVKDLQRYDVFFAAPLDLDFLMLNHFPEAYHNSAGADRGPDIPEDGEEGFDEALEEVTRSVLKQSGGDGATYSATAKREFFWYRYLFLGRGKPTTHMAALSGIDVADLKKECPPILGRLVKRMHEILAESEKAAVNAE